MELIKPEINKSIQTNKNLDELAEIWKIKYDAKIKHNNLFYYTTINKAGNLEERTAEVYEIKGNLVTRHPNRLVFTFDREIIGIGNVVVEKSNKFKENVEPARPKTSRLGALTVKNQKEIDKKQHDESRNKIFANHFLIQQSHLDVMVDSLLSEVNLNSSIKFVYQITQNLSKLTNISLNEAPKFFFFNVSGYWNAILFRKNPKNNQLEGICKDMPIEKNLLKIKNLSRVEYFTKYNYNEETSDHGLQAIAFVINIGIDYYQNSFKSIEKFKHKRVDLIRWPLLIDIPLGKLNKNAEFIREYNESIVQIPDENEKLKKYKQLISKFAENQDDDDDNSCVDENMIKELEEAKKEMLAFYKDNIDHFTNEYEYINESKNLNDVSIGYLKIENKYPFQILQIQVIIEIFKQYYQKNKQNVEPLIDDEFKKLKSIFVSDKLKKRMDEYLFQKAEEVEINSEKTDNGNFITEKETIKRPDSKNKMTKSDNKSVFEIVSELNLFNNLTSDFIKAELCTKLNLIENNKYGKRINDWNVDEIKDWSKCIKGFLLNNNHALLTSIAVMDRANELVTGGHRLRNTQKIAIFIFMGGKYNLVYDQQKDHQTDDLVFFLNEKKNLAYRFKDHETEILEEINNCNLSKSIYNEIKNNLKSYGSKQNTIHVQRLENNFGHISQIKTGEGKTTIVSFISALKVLQGYKVDVLTSNQVLAADGVREKLDFYKLLNITVSHNNPYTGEKSSTRKCYKADIVYGSINNFQFDFLRDRFECLNTFGDRKPENNWVVLDEVDSLLIDQGGNIAKLSSPLPGMENLKYIYINIWKALELNEKDIEIEIQANLENKKIKLQEKLTEKMNNLKKKYDLQLKDISKDEHLNKLLIEKQADSSLNKTIIDQLECEIMKKQLEIFKNYNLMVGETIENENDIVFSKRDSKLIILSKMGQSLIEADSNKISKDFYDFIIDKVTRNIKTINLSKYADIEILKAFPNICSFARIQVAQDLKEIEDLEEENQEEYDKEVNDSSNRYLDLVESKIKNQKEILSELINKGLIPKHLHKFVNSNFGRWIESAISAKYHYRENQQYKLINQNEEVVIIPVDNLNTGVSMYNTILSNGVHQFLQIKHNLCLTFESLTSSYISNLGYIKKYGSKILGLTGTLGSSAEQDLLGDVYNIEFSEIPTYKHKKICEFPGKIVKDSLFSQNISILALAELLRKNENIERPRAVLIICDSIRDVNEIETEIKNQALKAYMKPNVKIYTDEAEAGITEVTLEPKDIVIATNIAGRGTDFKTSEELEKNDGLHVIVGFLPCNQRVQDQALGRTSRQGNNGSGQLVVRTSEIEKIGANENTNFNQVLLIRDELEMSRISDVRSCKVKDLNFKDNLFEQFSQLYTELKKAHKYDLDPKWNYIFKDLKERWAFWLEEQYYNENKDYSYLAEFKKFKSDETVLKILNSEDELSIAHNPYYAICLAEEYLDLGGKENIVKAKYALNKAIEIGGDSESLYSAYIKLFEIAMIEGAQILERYKKALGDIIFIPLKKDENYKNNSLKYLYKAKKALEIEKIYLDDLFKEGNLNSIIIGPSSKSNETISMSYWYSDSDTNRIGERLKTYGVNTNTCFKGRLTIDVINSLPKDIAEDKPIFISFNIGGNSSTDSGIHWIAIVIVKHSDIIHVLYKDSKGDFGQNSEKIKEKFIDHYGTKLLFIQNNVIEQKDDSSCGPMTMNNLEIMAAKVKEGGVNTLISEFKSMRFTDQSQVQELRKNQNPNEQNYHENNKKGTESNLFLKHLQARHTCIGVFLGNIETIINDIEEKFSKNVSFDIGLKAFRYLNKLDSNKADQKAIKDSISDKDVYELNNIGMGCVYGLKEIYDVPKPVIESAKVQILSGLSLLLGALYFPPALPVCGPIAGTLISEGITDIIMELIKQGEKGFSSKDYIKGKIVSYGISIITMGIGAIMSSEKILNKAMNTCRNLASKLRNCKRFKGVCNFIANNLDRIANYLEKTISKIKFAKMCVQDQRAFLAGLQNTNQLKEFQDLQKILKVSDMALSNIEIIRKIAIDSVVNTIKGVTFSVCTEKIVTASLNKVMSGLEPKINETVKKTVEKKVNEKKHLLNQLDDNDLNKKIESLFETSISEDILEVLKDVSLGVLRHSSNWQMQAVSLGVDSAVVIRDVLTCTNRICDKVFRNLTLEGNSKCNRDYSKLIENISNQISKIIYNKIVSLTGKLVITIPKIAYRGYKEHQENISDRKAIEKLSERLKAIKEADNASREKGGNCLFESTGTIFEMNSEELALASSMGASENGTSLGEIVKVMEDCGVKSKVCDGNEAAAVLSEQNSDRGIICFQNDQGQGHAIPCFLTENGMIMVTDKNNNQITLEQFIKENNYKNNYKVVVPSNLNKNNMNEVKSEINRLRIARYTHPINYVGQGNDFMYGKENSKLPTIMKGDEGKEKYKLKDGKWNSDLGIDKDMRTETSIDKCILETTNTIKTVLKNMKDQKKLTESEYQAFEKDLIGEENNKIYRNLTVNDFYMDNIEEHSKTRMFHRDAAFEYKIHGGKTIKVITNLNYDIFPINVEEKKDYRDAGPDTTHLGYNVTVIVDSDNDTKRLDSCGHIFTRNPRKYPQYKEKK